MVGYFKFAALCVRRAFTKSFDMADQIATAAAIITGALGYFGIQIIPHVDGWMIAAFLLFAIVAVRLFLAPYWVWKEQREEIEALKSIDVDGQAQRLEQWVRSKDSFPIGHAACLLAGQPMVSGEPEGLASGHIWMIRQRLIAGHIQPAGGRKNEIMFAQMAASTDGLLEAKPLNPDQIRISKADLRALAIEFDLPVPGLTDSQKLGKGQIAS